MSCFAYRGILGMQDYSTVENHRVIVKEDLLPLANPNTGWPRKNGTVDTVDFQDFALINSYFLHFVG